MNTYVIKNNLKAYLISLLRCILIMGIGFMILYPMLMKIMIALRSSEDLLNSSVTYLPKSPTLDVFKQAFKMLDYKNALINTVLICSLSGILQVASCTLLGYSLGRFKFFGRRLIFGLVIFTLVVPPQVLSIPNYLNFRHFLWGFNLLDNPVSLLLLYATANALKSGLYVFLLTQFFKNMPLEIEEAALVDGAGPMKTLFYIMMPSARLMMVTVFLFTFVWQWTDYYYSAMFFQNYEILSLKLTMLGGACQMYIVHVLHLVAQPLVISQMNNAGSILFILPLIIIYLICNRYFIEGIERSGIVG